MERVYLKNNSFWKWYSGKVSLLKYFKSFSEAYGRIVRRHNMSCYNTFLAVLDNECDMNKKETLNLINEFRETGRKFKTTLPSLSIIEKKIKMLPRKINVEPQAISDEQPSEICLENNQETLTGTEEQMIRENNQTSVQHENENGRNNTEEKSVKERINDIYNSSVRNSTFPKSSLKISKLRNRILFKQAKYKKSILTSRSELLLNKKVDENGKRNLKRGKHFLVSFRIHEPFIQRTQKGRVGNFQQEIVALGHQTLLDLRDKIICPSDFQDVRGDISKDPDSPVTQFSRDKYKSAMFYFDNTFYIDERADLDYSEVVREWASPHGITVGPTRNMGSVRVSDLQIRFGYPYLFTHQGSCEHLVIISDARLLMGRDSQDSGDYPLLSRIPRHNTEYCFICLKMPVKWIVYGCEQLPVDFSLLCTKCFKSFNYVDGKKVGDFKAFRYFQRNMLL